MAYLCSQKMSGRANAYTIANRSGIPAQESNRFKGFLQELYEKGCITIVSMDTSSQERGRVIFQITEVGEKIIQAYNEHNLALVLGPLNDSKSDS